MSKTTGKVMLGKSLPALVLILALPLQVIASEAPTVAKFPRTSLTASSDAALSVEFELTDVDIKREVLEGETFEHFAIPGEGFTYEDGRPVLPAITRLVVVPPQAGVELMVRADEPRLIEASFEPVMCRDENYPVLTLNEEAELYPPVFAEMGEPIVIRGVRLVPVTTYPVQYNQRTNSYLVRSRIETELIFTDAEPVNPAYFPVRRNRSPEFLKLIRSIAINGDQTGRDDPDRDQEPEYVGHYLIATHESCLEHFAEWIEFRRKTGWKMDILSLSSNDANNTGTIYNRIRAIYNEYLEAGEDPFDQLLLVGDRASYYTGSGQAGWQLAAETGNSVWGSPPHADYRYARVEGNDEIPDVGFSRWCAGSPTTLGLFLGRTMAYEAEPYMDDTDWFTRGGVFSQHWGNSPGQAWHITVNSNVRWAEELLQHKSFDEVRFYESYDYDQMGSNVGPFERDLFNDGANMLVGRAEDYHFRDALQGVRDNVVFPIRIVSSGHGEWTAWNIMRNDQAGPNHLRGAVLTTCGWGGPVTMDMTIVWIETVSGALLDDLTLGWARVKALVGPATYIPRNNLSQYAATDFDMYGDPGIQPWIGVPRVVETEITETITPQTRLIEVYVHDAENDTIPVEGAQVTLYAPGDMPDFDEDDYAEYEDMLMITHRSAADGRVRFVLGEDVELVEDTGLFITISGRDIRPHFDEFSIGVTETFVELEDYTLTEVAGNGDEFVNPGERFALTISAVNLGDDGPAENVIAQVASLSPYVTVEGDTLVFEAIPAGESREGDGEVELLISMACPDGATRPVTRPDILVEFTDGEETWRSAFRLNPVAPNIEVKQVVGTGIINTGANEVNIEVENIGGVTIPAFTARIDSRGIGIQPVREFASYPELEPGENARVQGDRFVVAGNALVVPGLINEMLLVFSIDDEVIDSAFFNLQVREPGRNMPQGPDRYGYVCYDDTDTDWPTAPEYDWVEISLRNDDRDFDGTRINFTGNSPNDIGEARVIPLGFPTQFYGHEYDSITVVTLGYICPGTQPRAINHQNWPMDRAMGGGAGMIAPFWDDLRLGDNSGVYYYHDTEEHLFIVEWYQLRYASGGGDRVLTFEAILYDKRYWVSETGDPMILFQYESVLNMSNLRGGDGAWTNATPYASVGISGPDGGGINYTYNNIYPVTSVELQNRRALLFATSDQSFCSGFLFGHVYDEATGDPIAEAMVMASYGYVATTDEEGYWAINEALAERRFDLTASKIGYNDSTLVFADTVMSNEDTLEIDFLLLHPEFLSSTPILSARMDPDRTNELDFDIRNNGNGPLDWSLVRRLPDNAEAEPWELRLSHHIGAMAGDARIEGVVFANGCFYVSGANRFGRIDEADLIYVLNHDGELIDSLEQPVNDSPFGMKDLAWDGELIWGSGHRNIYSMTTDGEFRDTLEGPYNPNQALAWDPVREILWVSAITQGIRGINRDADSVASLDRKGLRIYGLAFWRDDPDSCQLYIFTNPAGGNQCVYKMNIDNGDTMFVANLGSLVSGNAGGAFITNQYDVYSWVFIDIANDGEDDRIDMWQLDARRDWFRVFLNNGDECPELASGRIDAQQVQNYILRLNSAELPTVLFEGFLVFYHNAIEQESAINVSMQVIGPEPPTHFTLLYPENGALVNANDSTAVTFAWTESIDYNFEDVVSYRQWFTSGEDSASIEVANNSWTADILDLADSLGLNIEERWALTWWIEAISGGDVVPSDTQFVLNFLPNGMYVEETIPVEFGLHGIYPNPFNALTTVRFGIDRPDRATLKVYDVTGRQVATLFDRKSVIGNHQLSWNAASLPSGLYIMKLESAGKTEVAKVALVR